LAELQRPSPAPAPPASPFQPFKKLSDLAALYNNTFNAASVGSPTLLDAISTIATPGSPATNWGKWERDAIIAKSADLFTTSNADFQTYTILMRADSYSSGPGMEDVGKGTVLGTTYAVAEVLRDPVPVGGRHPIRIQSFKILE